MIGIVIRFYIKNQMGGENKYSLLLDKCDCFLFGCNAHGWSWHNKWHIEKG